MPKTDNIIEQLKHFAQLYSINSLFVVGGYCRDKLLGSESSDIDVASAHTGKAMMMCGLFASEVLHTTPTFYHKTGTGMVEVDGVRVEFQNESTSSYMANEEITSWLRRNNVVDNDLLHNIYGRDLTINSIIMSLQNGEMYDLTKRGVDDIENKRINTILPANLIVKYNPMIILRAIRFSCKYGFSIDPLLRKEMKQQVRLLTKAYSKERISTEIEKILEVNAKEGLKQLNKYGLTSHVLPEQFSKYVEVESK